MGIKVSTIVWQSWEIWGWNDASGEDSLKLRWLKCFAAMNDYSLLSVIQFAFVAVNKRTLLLEQIRGGVPYRAKQLWFVSFQVTTWKNTHEVNLWVAHLWVVIFLCTRTKVSPRITPRIHLKEWKLQHMIKLRNKPVIYNSTIILQITLPMSARGAMYFQQEYKVH